MKQEEVKKQWLNFGFYYDIRDKEKIWYMAGAKKGLLNFYNILIEYINDYSHTEISSHEHYGPYAYLEIMTWEKPKIDSHAIQGTLKDLQRLADIFNTKLKNISAGQYFIIGEEYAKDCEYSIYVEVMDDDFDPSSAKENHEK